MASQTDPLASGIGTSEGKLTVALCLVGVALESFAAVLTQKIEEYPGVHWIAVTAMVVGAAVQVLAVLGYSKNRSELKANALVQAIASGVPVVVTAISQAALKNLPQGVKDQARVAAAIPAVSATKAADPAAAAAAVGAAATGMAAAGTTRP